MRSVAVLLALSTVLVALPFAEADDCITDVNRGTVCRAFNVDRPITPPGGPTVPSTPYWGSYYLFLGPGLCTSNPLGNDCRQTPASPGSGVPLPTSGAAGAGVFGVLFQESNGLPGLQRKPIDFGGPKLADHMILV